MEQHLLNHFREKLLSEKKRLLQSVEEEIPALLEVKKGHLSDETDHANSTLSQTLGLRLKKRDLKLVEKIEKALERIESGEFGDCDMCGEPIETKRLEARLVATLCILCKEAEEAEEKRFADIPMA